MISTGQIHSLMGGAAEDAAGTKIGKVGQVYLDDETGQPAWATVNTGLFGTSESFVPLDQAQVDGRTLRVPYDKDKVKGAPNVAADGHLSPSEEDQLYRYYGLGSAADLDASQPVATGTQGHDTSGPTTDDAMTRSEERLKVGTQTREAGRARLRKYVVTEEQTVTVPVSRDEVTVTREPITDANRPQAMDGPEITEAVHEVVLREEVPVATKTTVPVERVRLGTQTVTEQVQVTEDVRKERIETEGDTSTATNERR